MTDGLQYDYAVIKLLYCHTHSVVNYVVMAEWLRRLTRNQMGYSLTGSNPVHDEIFYWNKIF